MPKKQAVARIPGGSRPQGRVNRQQKKPQNLGPSSSAGGGGNGGWSNAIKLSPCAKDYLACLANPSSGPLACIPDYPALFSRRMRTWVKGTFSTSSTAGPGLGLGFIVFDPLRSLANDTTGCVVTSTTATATNTIVIDAATAQTFNSNSDQVLANYGPGIGFAQGRVVAAALRIRYIGTELNRGGQAVGLMQPNHQSFQNTTLGGLDSFEQSRRFKVGEKWMTVLYRPVDNNDLQYVADPTQGTAALPGSIDAFYMGFAVRDPGGTANPMAFEFEAYSVLEIQGNNIRGQTPSAFDPVGFGVVHGATQHNLSALLPTDASLADVAGNLLGAAVNYGIRELTTVQRVPTKQLQLETSKGSSGGFDWWGTVSKVGGWAAEAVMAML